MKPENCIGKNKGKKYIKLQGYEIPTPESEKRAIEFMEWYAANMHKLKYYAQGEGGIFDADIFSDTFLKIYDAIALKGFKIKDYTGYFLRSYRLAFINSKKIDKTAVLETDVADTEFNSYMYEEVIEKLNNEVMEYVRLNYDEISVSLFEMYIGLAPDISYKRLANMLGYPEFKIWPVIGKIKKDVTKRFSYRKDFLLSIVEF